MSQEPEPIPHGLEHIESIAQRLRSVLTELQDANLGQLSARRLGP